MHKRSHETNRLLLVGASQEILEAELKGPTALGEALGADVAKEWPPELYDEDAIHQALRQLRERPEAAGWWTWYFIVKAGAVEEPLARPLVVGVGGYKGPPDSDGEIEVGYSLVASWQGRGLATEAVRGLIDHAFADPLVHRVAAETLPDLTASKRVLERLGFEGPFPGSEPGVERFRLERGSPKLGI